MGLLSLSATAASSWAEAPELIEAGQKFRLILEENPPRSKEQAALNRQILTLRIWDSNDNKELELSGVFVRKFTAHPPCDTNAAELLGCRIYISLDGSYDPMDPDGEYSRHWLEGVYPSCDKNGSACGYPEKPGWRLCDPVQDFSYCGVSPSAPATYRFLLKALGPEPKDYWLLLTLANQDLDQVTKVDLWDGENYYLNYAFSYDTFTLDLKSGSAQKKSFQIKHRHSEALLEKAEIVLQ